MSRSYRAFRTTVVVSALGYCAQGLSLVAIPLFLKTVGAEGYGLMVTVMAFMGYLTFADAGLSWGAMILIAQAEGRGDRAGVAHIVRHGAVLALGSGLVVLAALGLILTAARAGWRLPMFSAHPSADRLLLIAGVQLALNLQFGIIYNLFQGLQEGHLAGIYSGLGRLTGLTGAMFAAWQTQRVDLMMLAQLGGTFVFGLAALVHARRRHPWALAAGSWRDRTQYEAQLRLGAKNLLLQAGRTLGGTAPTLAISSILGPAWVPFYTVPTTLLTMFFAPVASWNASMQSAYGEAWASGAQDWVRGAFRLTLERALLAGALGTGLFLALGDGFIRWWTHGRLWVDPAMAASVAGIVGLGAFLTAGQFLLAGLNRHRRVALAEMANGLASLLFVSLAVRWLGLNAVGLGAVAAALATSAWVLRREIAAQLGPDCFPAGRFMLKAGVAGLAGAAAAALVARGGAADGLAVAAQLLGAGFAGATIFLLAAFGLNLVAMNDATALWQRLRQRHSAPA